MAERYHEQFARSLKGRPVVVVGLARTGQACARLLVELGARVTVSDIKGPDELREALEDLPPEVELALGGHPLDVFGQAHLVVTSPGVPWESEALEAARRAGVEVISEIELAWRLIPTPWVAVTGTNGKSTTTTLIGQMARASGLRAIVGGNIGAPVAGLVDEALRADFLVAEVSTFQLEGVRDFRPALSVVLNVTEDHLDRHGSFQAYAALKRRLFENQGAKDSVVLNEADPVIRSWKPGVPGRLYGFRARGPLEGRGVFVEGGEVVWAEEGGREALFGLEELSGDARRNLENVLAAVCVSRLMGVATEAMVETLRGFRSLPHRLEEVATIRGVTFINDSKATNVGALLCALSSIEGSVVLIAGGQDKAGDFSPLRDVLARKARAVVLMGEAADRLALLLEGSVALDRAQSMEEAVERAFRLARPGDVVLLGPACASFDMFRDFEERGQRFVEAVRSLR